MKAHKRQEVRYQCRGCTWPGTLALRLVWDSKDWHLPVRLHQMTSDGDVASPSTYLDREQAIHLRDWLSLQLQNNVQGDDMPPKIEELETPA